MTALAELLCLATAVYFEARSEPPEGRLAVAQVIVQRAESGTYPLDLCSVIHQGPHVGAYPVRHRCQFSFYCDGKSEAIRDTEAWLEAVGAAIVAYVGLSIPELEGCLFYHTVNVAPVWNKSLDRCAVIGQHVFWKHTR